MLAAVTLLFALATPADAAAQRQPEARQTGSSPSERARQFLGAHRRGEAARWELLLVSGVAGAGALTAAGVAAGVGLWAVTDYACLSNVTACNATRPASQRLSGTGYLEALNDGQNKALFADAAGVAALALAALAVLAFVAALPVNLPWAGERS
ncbi:MAG: hypothetical protein AB2A00_42640 [Myxococcota bacterium]